MGIEDYEVKQLKNNELEIKKYNGNETNVVIPKTIDGQTVVCIGFQSFAQSEIKSVTIPNTIVEIKRSAFNECKSLSEIIFEENSKLQYIRDYAFRYCEGLVSVVIPNSVLEIGEYGFGWCSNLTNMVFSEKLEKLSKGVIANTSVAELNIPESVTIIEDYAFSDSKMDTIVVPKNVTSIGKFEYPSVCSDTFMIKTVIFKDISKIRSFDKMSLFANVAHPNPELIIEPYEGTPCTNMKKALTEKGIPY